MAVMNWFSRGEQPEADGKPIVIQPTTVVIPSQPLVRKI